MNSPNTRILRTPPFANHRLLLNASESWRRLTPVLISYFEARSERRKFRRSRFTKTDTMKWRTVPWFSSIKMKLLVSSTSHVQLQNLLSAPTTTLFPNFKLDGISLFGGFCLLVWGGGLRSLSPSEASLATSSSWHTRDSIRKRSRIRRCLLYADQ